MGLLDRLGNLFRTYAIPEGSVVVPSRFHRDDRNCFTFVVPDEWPSDHAGVSTVRVLEDGQHLGPASVSHDDVRTLGRGRYSHWDSKIYFSTSDNTDPNSNGRTYSVVPPAGWDPGPGGNAWAVRQSQRGKGDLLEVKWAVEPLSPTAIAPAGGQAFAVPLRGLAGADADDHSTLLVLEDGKPLALPHQTLAQVQAQGQGSYGHLPEQVAFSSSDGSDPRSNGRQYALARADAFVFAHAAQAPKHEHGHCWILPGLPKSWTAGQATRVRLLEDGRLLGPPDSQHAPIRDPGLGAYCVWGADLWFSSSDGSDPNTNGRTYTVLLLPEDD